jgi:hypothetical protein
MKLSNIKTMSTVNVKNILFYGFTSIMYGVLYGSHAALFWVTVNKNTLYNSKYKLSL